MRLARLFERVAGSTVPEEPGEDEATEGRRDETDISRRDAGADGPLTSAWTGFQHWVLVGGDRRHVAVVLLVAVYAVLLVLGHLWPFEIQTLLTERVTVQRLFTTLLNGVILLVSIVVSINSLVVSQELAPVGSQQEQVAASWEFRDRVADLLRSDATPGNPDEFLEELIDVAQRELDGLASAAATSGSDADEDLRSYVETARSYLRRTRAAVQKGGVGVVDVELFGPAYEPSSVLDQARQFRRRGSHRGEVDEALGTVVDALQYFTTAREYFKTVYYKREFSKLSRDLLYTGLPAILLISYVLLALDSEAFPGVTFGLDHLFMFVSGAYVVALLPFLMLTSYVLRAALVAEYTITAGAFVVK